MTLQSTQQTSSIALSRDESSRPFNPGFLSTSHNSPGSLNVQMQDVSDHTFFNVPVVMTTFSNSNNIHDLLKTQIQRDLDSCYASASISPVTNDVSSLNNRAQLKSSACPSSTKIYPRGASNRIIGPGRVVKVGKQRTSSSASIYKKESRARKAQLFKAFAPLEKAKNALYPYSMSSESFRQESESLFLKLEMLIDQAICSDHKSDSCSTSEPSNSDIDSAYRSFSGTSLSEFGSCALEKPNFDVESEAHRPESSDDLEDDINMNAGAPRLELPSEPVYQCTFEARDKRCPYSTSRESDWVRHEESEKHWPQKRYMCLHCAEPQYNESLNPYCIYCLSEFPTRKEVLNHSLNCIEARKKGETFAGARTDHFRTHLTQVHQLAGLDKTSTSWTYKVTTKWPRYCGFCTYYFKDWESRKGHVALHFKEGADVSMWDPLLHKPRRQHGDEPSSLPRNEDDDDDDDDDDSHQHGKGRHSINKAAPDTYYTSSNSSSSSSSYVPQDVFWANGEVGWHQYKVEYEKTGWESLDDIDFANIALQWCKDPRRGRLASEFGLPSLDWISDLKFRQLHKLVVPKGKNPHFNLSSCYVSAEKTPHQAFPNLQRSIQKGYSCRFPSGCSKVFRRSADLQRHYKLVHAHADQKSLYSCGSKRRATDNDPFTRKDHYRDYLKDFHEEDVDFHRFSYARSNSHKPSRLDDRDGGAVMLSLARHRRQVARPTTVTSNFSDPWHSVTRKLVDRGFVSSNAVERGLSRFKKCNGKEVISLTHDIMIDRSPRFQLIATYKLQKRDINRCYYTSFIVYDNRPRKGIHNSRSLMRHNEYCHRSPGYSYFSSWNPHCSSHFRHMNSCCKAGLYKNSDQPKDLLDEGYQCEPRPNYLPCELVWSSKDSGRFNIMLEYITWIIHRGPLDPPGYQKLKPELSRSVALERYLSEYNRSEHLAYLTSQGVGDDATIASHCGNKSKRSFLLISCDYGVPCKGWENAWCYSFKLPVAWDLGQISDGR
ncbi:hypothetical protein OCU04_009913 [Sclerotinia nivalis]|uniref:C2H2-type domain-containing protein n=1 Tax=Sclerotinia nivalis TaxID=352851 RepID=A0A9X0DFE5_9HELO|nr:hypothetical protein OCU04_009913 [Sclerotinia nivalis]